MPPPACQVCHYHWRGLGCIPRLLQVSLTENLASDITSSYPSSCEHFISSCLSPVSFPGHLQSEQEGPRNEPMHLDGWVRASITLICGQPISRLEICCLQYNKTFCVLCIGSNWHIILRACRFKHFFMSCLTSMTTWVVGHNSIMLKLLTLFIVMDTF